MFARLLGLAWEGARSSRQVQKARLEAGRDRGVQERPKFLAGPGAIPKAGRLGAGGVREGAEMRLLGGAGPETTCEAGVTRSGSGTRCSGPSFRFARGWSPWSLLL